MDTALLWVVAVLLLLGGVMVYSASSALVETARFSSYTETTFATKHLVFVSIGCIAGGCMFCVPLSIWQRCAFPLFCVSLLFLLLLFLPGFSVRINGAKRWFSLMGLHFQPSEFFKLTTILYMADYMVRKRQLHEHFFKITLPIAGFVGLAAVLLLLEPDMGAFLVITVIIMSLLFLGRVNLGWMICIALTLVASFLLIIFLSEFRTQRVFAYLHPWDLKNALGKGYQLTHALIGFGRGGFSGVGLGASIEKLHWLPEAHTDFLLAVLAEELGLLGVTVVVGCFAWLGWRIFSIGRTAVFFGNLFAGLVAQGVGIWLTFQAAINIGVNTGALPTKGLTLPLMSYGGSAMLFNLIALALVLRVDFDNKRLQKPNVLPK